MKKKSKETKKEQLNSDENIKSALIKKALGYDSKEVTEEYVSEEGEIVLSKKKVTTKNVPPDITAIKMLLKEDRPITELSDEELEKEKIRLLKLLED